MMATIERIRCWFVPMRPVTPFMMMPMLWMFMVLIGASFYVLGFLRALRPGARGQRRGFDARRGSVPSSSCRQWATSPAGP